MGIESGAAGAALEKGGGNIISLIFGFLFAYWRLGITLICVFIILVHTIPIAVREHSALPFFTEIGGRTLASDALLYQNIQDKKYLTPIDGEGFIANTKYYFNLTFIYLEMLMNLWFIYIVWYVIYWCVSRTDDSKILSNVLIATLFFILINTVASLILYDYQYAGTTMPDKNQITQDLSIRALPFKGVISFIMALPEIIQPAYNKATTIKPNVFDQVNASA